MNEVISTQSLGVRLFRSRGSCKVCGAPASTCGPDHLQYPPVESRSEKRARAKRADAEGDEKSVRSPNKRIEPPEPTQTGTPAPASDQPAESEPREGRARSQRRRRVAGK